MNNWSSQYANLFFYNIIPELNGVYYYQENAYAGWNDYNSGLFSYELWYNTDGSSFRKLIANLPPGTTSTNFSFAQGVIMGIKVNSVNQYGFPSPDSFPVFYKIPLTFRTDQSILTPIVFQVFNIAAGGTIIINWGDLTPSTVLTGANINVTHNYGVISNPYYITINGDFDKITSIQHNGQVLSYGFISLWQMQFAKVPISIVFDNCNFANLPLGKFDWMSVYNFQNNVCSAITVSNFLIYLDNYFLPGTGVVPKCNCTYTINGAGMGALNAAGLAAKASIQAKYIAAGFVATINNN